MKPYIPFLALILSLGFGVASAQTTTAPSPANSSPASSNPATPSLQSLNTQTLTSEVKQAIDAQAYAFGKQHCTGEYTSKAPIALSASRFGFVTRLMDMTIGQTVKARGLTYRSDTNNKDLYRALVSKGEQGQGFVLAYLNGGKLYTYGCQVGAN